MREVFDDDDIVVSDSTTAEDVLGWDSLMHINLIIAIENHYSIKFATAEIAGLQEDGQNVGTFLQLVANKLK
jgi:acyl carrier protein